MIRRTSMGRLEKGTEVERFTLVSASGAYCELSSLGGCILSVCVPDKLGNLGDVTLGYDRLETLLTGRGYMGKLVGRYANRIGGASFALNGRTYALSKNNGENHLHGGLAGFDQKVWDAEVSGEAIVFALESPDGDEGYPGRLNVRVTYTFGEDNALCIRYEAESDADTIVNLTNHAYFNLSGPGGGDVLGHEIQIDADAICEVKSAACIPTGRLMPVEGTPFDLRRARRIGEGLSHQEENVQMRYGNGYDHNFVLNGWDGKLRRAAIVTDPKSGRTMETWTDQPGVQFYGGNNISGDTPGKLGVPYRVRQGFCLETQRFPDSVHHPHFPSCVLKKGEKYETTTEYRFFA